jgi:hypothetical protein
MMSVFSYAQVRCLYEADRYWEPELATTATVPLAAGSGSGGSLPVLSG